MSLILQALAFLPQVTLARLTGSTKICAMCGIPYGVRGLRGVVFPCGHTFGECKCCTKNATPTASSGPKQRRSFLEDSLSSEIKCPYCGTLAVGRDHLEDKDHTAVAALHAAEARLSWEKKLELRRQPDLVGPRSTTEWGRDDDDDWIIEHTSDQYLEMDFAEILEYGI